MATVLTVSRGRGVDAAENARNLTQCGMKLSDALVQAEIRNTPFAKAHIQTMREQAIGQTNLGAILDTGLFTAKRTQRDEGPWHSRQLHRTAQRKRATPQ